MTHPDLPKLFAEACAACHELTDATIDIDRSRHGWWIGEGEGCPDSGHLASLAIFGACVKVLCRHNFGEQLGRGHVLVDELTNGDVAVDVYCEDIGCNGGYIYAASDIHHEDQACAACLAVVAVFGKENKR